MWAPHAERVEIEVAAAGGPTSTEPMESAGGGWWTWHGRNAGTPGKGGKGASGATGGTAARGATGGKGATARAEVLDYAFRLDGGDPRPDPRTAWQPQGVHGPSRTFDASAHQWADAVWAGPQQGLGTLGGVVYELHVGTFTPQGTLDAAVRRLDHLVSLGVDVVELMPLAAFDGRWNWGYDGVAPYAVHDAYGGPAALQRCLGRMPLPPTRNVSTDRARMSDSPQLSRNGPPLSGWLSV